MGGKMRETIFPETHELCEEKNVAKISSEKSATNRFLYTYEYLVQKKGTKKCAKQFFQIHTNSAKKMLGKKSLEKRRKNVFYIHTNIVTKKWGQKNARNNFSRNSRIVRAKNVGKNRL